MSHRLRLIFWALAALAVSSSAARATVAVPAITEPEYDNQVISPYDVHMVAGPFVGSPGENHVCSDWELRNTATNELVWSASCVQGTLAVHIHLGDGQFTGSLTGDHELRASTGYTLRVRFLGDAPPPNTDWSDWATRPFVTASASVILPLILSDVAALPAPRWQDDSGQPVLLPAGFGSVLRLEAQGGGTLLQWTSSASGNQVFNPAAVASHGPVHVYVAAGPSLDLPESHLLFTDGSGQDRDIALPPIVLAAGGTAGFWIDVAGDAFTAVAVPPPGAAPDFSTQVSAATIPWAVRQPGYVIDLVASNLQLPVNIAFVTTPGPNPSDLFFYVTELYGNVQAVTRDGTVSQYATGLLNFDPLGSFPGSGEKGLAGIAVEPASGDLFVSAVEAVPPEVNNHFPRVMRLHSADGGLTMASETTILDFPTEPLGPSHQISNLSIGPDGKLYVHIGDGLFVPTPAQDLTSVRGKILRVNLDGSAPTDNPFYATANGVLATQLIYAYGLRNPFGGAWRQADGAQWEAENGPSVDRLAKIVAGRNYLYDGTDASMMNFAAYNWSPAVAPVNIAFVQPGTFGGSGFPAEKMDHAYVTESGPTYAPGPQGLGKRISEFSFDLAGNLTSGPTPLIEYIGAGRATATALAAGPDGLYFGDLYKDFGETTPVDRGAHVFRIRYVGVADFTSSLDTCVAGQSVAFTDASTVPSASAWHWDFGDGGVSSDRNPVHVYEAPGSFDVRLTVTGAAGEAVRQKPAEIVVAPAPRTILPVPEPLPGTMVLEPR